MTDVIGWGDVEAQPRRRRGPRLPRVLHLPRWSWVIVVVALVAAALVTPVRDRFAGNAARWLVQRWAEAGAVEDARALVMYDIGQSAGFADQRLETHAAQVTDRQAAGRLAAIEASVARHRTWSSDVTTAARAVRVALRAQARDLRAQAASDRPGDLGYPPSTGRLVDTATARMTALQRHRHLKPPPVSVRLDAAAADLAVLHRPTNTPTHLHLAVATGGVPVRLIDLDTGRERRSFAYSVAGFQPTVLGSRVLMEVGEGDYRLFEPATGAAIRLPRAADYLPAGAHALWEIGFDQRVRRVDASAHPTSGWHRIPPGFVPEFYSTPDAVAITDNIENSTVTAFWQPLTGTMTPAPESCLPATAGYVVAWSCDSDTIHFYDERTKRERVFAAPAGSMLDGSTPVALSPDGRYAATVESTRTGADEHVTVLDAATGRFIDVLDSAGLGASNWSADGHWLLLGPTDQSSNYLGAQLAVALWHPGDTSLTSLRITDFSTDSRVTLLP